MCYWYVPTTQVVAVKEAAVGLNIVKTASLLYVVSRSQCLKNDTGSFAGKQPQYYSRHELKSIKGETLHLL